MSESGLEAKQQYMRVNIIEAGYDAEKFVDFCAKTHDLDDLQNWKMEQLIDIVAKFIKMNSNKESNVQNTDEDEFGGFQQAKIKSPVRKTQPVNPLPEKNLAMNLTDDDWNNFLSAPSLLSSTSQPSNKGSFDLPSDLLMDFNQVNSQKQKKKQPEKTKQSPLSPPSTIQPRTSTPKIEEKQKSLIDQKIVQKPEKGGKKNQRETCAINLSNIKITTAKQKLQPLLPLINDIVVGKTEQVSRNFLQSDYTVYHISFPPTKHVVKRKFSDFRKVRNILQKLYPFLRLPYLEPEGWINSSEGRDPDTLQKYKWMIEQFLKYVLLKSKQLKDCEIVRILCGLSMNGEKDDLKKKIEILQNAGRPKYVGQIVLNDNSFVIPPVTGCDKLIQNTTSILGQIDVQYQKLKKQLQHLFSTYDALTKNYKQITTTFQNLQSLTKKYNIDNNEAKEIRIFEGLKQMTAKMSTRINGDLQVFRNKIKNFIRYQKQNISSLKQIFQGRTKIHSQYLKQGSPAFTSNSMRMQGSNVEIESPVPLQDPVRNNKNTLALQQAFWSFVMTQEINRYWQHLRWKVSEHLTVIAYEQLDSQNQNLNFWNTMIKKCVV